MAGTNLPLYYWDTCLFLAWLKDEERKSGEMDGVRDIIQKGPIYEFYLWTIRPCLYHRQGRNR
jgi:hypothetical protein